MAATHIAKQLMSSRYISGFDQAVSFLSQFVAITRDREIASDWRYFVTLYSSIEFEEEGGRWMRSQQLENFAKSMGWTEKH
jgi:hypothetical protein